MSQRQESVDANTRKENVVFAIALGLIDPKTAVKLLVRDRQGRAGSTPFAPPERPPTQKCLA